MFFSNMKEANLRLHRGDIYREGYEGGYAMRRIDDAILSTNPNWVPPKPKWYTP
jgi:hypothetical protein